LPVTLEIPLGQQSIIVKWPSADPVVAPDSFVSWPGDPYRRHLAQQEKAAPLTKALHNWILTQRDLVPNGSATAKALDYSLKRWVALTRYLEDGGVPIDSNAVENLIRPWALGRSNWLFAGSLRSGKRAAAIMSLIQSARMNVYDPYAYLKDVLTRLPTQRASEIEQLLPHQWTPARLAQGLSAVRLPETVDQKDL
jgi:hypothetical protein